MVFQQIPFWQSWFHLLTDWSGNGSAGQFWQMERALCWLLHWLFLFVEPFITCVVCRRAEKGAKAGWKCFYFLQGDQFMFWHNFLQVGEAYVFRNLRETTMNKVWYYEIMLKSWLWGTFLLLIHKSNLTASFSMMIYFLPPREQEMNDEFWPQLGIQSFKNISRE